MQHHVYFWLKDEFKTIEHRAAFQQALTKLLEIEVISQGIWGPPASTKERPVTDHSWDYAISLSFAGVEAHDIYQDHPAHHEFVNQCKDLWAQVKVYDVAVAAAE